MKKIVIIGATGAIGAYFTSYCQDRLGDGYEIVACGRKRSADCFTASGISYIPLNLCDETGFSVLPEKDVHAVVLLAGLLPAYTQNINPFEYVDVNIMGAVRTLEYARKVNADRIIYTQTWAEQAGFWGKEEVLSPELGRKLIYTGDHAFYSICKSMISDTMEYYKQEYGLKPFIFRLPNVYMYHPRMDYFVEGKLRHVAYRYMIEKAIKGENLELWGDPDAFKDILYVKDLCQMMYLAIFANINGGTYNAGTGKKTTLRQQIEGIIDVFSPNREKVEIIEYPEKSGFVSFVMDISKAERELGYQPGYGYLDYLEDYKKERELMRFDSMWMSSYSEEMGNSK